MAQGEVPHGAFSGDGAGPYDIGHGPVRTLRPRTSIPCGSVPGVIETERSTSPSAARTVRSQGRPGSGPPGARVADPPQGTVAMTVPASRRSTTGPSTLTTWSAAASRVGEGGLLDEHPIVASTASVPEATRRACDLIPIWVQIERRSPLPIGPPVAERPAFPGSPRVTAWFGAPRVAQCALDRRTFGCASSGRASARSPVRGCAHRCPR